MRTMHDGKNFTVMQPSKGFMTKKVFLLIFCRKYGMIKVKVDLLVVFFS